MLKIVKKITLNGESFVDGAQVAYMNAFISTNGTEGASINTSILNQDLYNANKEQVRKDIEDFEQAVYDVEDQLIAKTLEL